MQPDRLRPNRAPAVTPERFFSESGVIIVAGKGGVGKTTVTSALAVAASAAGLRTMVVEVEGKSALASIFDTGALSYDEIELVAPSPTHGGVRARTLSADDALLDYLAGRGMQRISNRLLSSGLLDIVSTAVPGIRDILVLGKVKQLERSDTADLILLDAPAAGHAISFLRSARGLADAVRSGPLNTQAEEVLSLLGDAQRCRVMLVTLPEETPVNELIETAFSLEEEVGVALGPVVINGVYPDLPGLRADPAAAAQNAGTHLLDHEAELLSQAAEFRQRRRALQEAQLDRMAEELPLAQLRLSYLFSSEMDRTDLDTLADELVGCIRDLPDDGAA